MADTLTAPANYIAGEWRPSAAGDTYEKRNPARPGEVVGEFPSSTREDVEAAARGGHPPRQLADGGRRRPRALRRRQGLRLRPARAGPGGARVLHRGRHR